MPAVSLHVLTFILSQFGKLLRLFELCFRGVNTLTKLRLTYKNLTLSLSSGNRHH
jgi:hypothetical protein